jgi:hypothetical protein
MAAVAAILSGRGQ